MTKKLSDQAKKEKKAARKQQKAASTTSTHVTQPKHEDPPADPVNLCDACAYEFGECEGKPKFASNQDETLTGPAGDRVVTCEGFLAVESMATAEEQRKAAAPGPAAAGPEEPDQGEGPAAAHDGDGEGPAEAEEPAETPTDELPYVPAPGPIRPDPKRFQDDTDYGACPSCDQPLKRTAYNRYRDAIRCVNRRCRAYRSIVKTISTGVK